MDHRGCGGRTLFAASRSVELAVAGETALVLLGPGDVAPIVVPPLARRSAELDRIIAEFAGDATFELGAPTSTFTAADHAWVRKHDE